MTGRRNAEIIVLISDIISSLASVTAEKLLLEVCSNVQFVWQLNFVSFAQMAYSLVKIIDCKLSEKLHWSANISKDRDSFAKALLLAIGEVKTRFPWAIIPMCQKSHLLDARAENDKVLEFLLGLASTASHLLANSEGGEDLSLLVQKTSQLEDAVKDLQKKTQRLRDENAEVTERNLLRPKMLMGLKQELANAGIVKSVEEATMEDLLKVKETIDEGNLKVISEILETEAVLYVICQELPPSLWAATTTQKRLSSISKEKEKRSP